MKSKVVRITVIVLVLFIAGFGVLWWLYSPVSVNSQPGVFTVPEQRNGIDLIQKLKKEGYIRNALAFRLLFSVFSGKKEIADGGFRLDQKMNAWQVMKKITGRPQFIWVTTSACLRREQIGEMIASKLGWNNTQLSEWNELYSVTKPEWAEGVYFPDTYLLPKDEPVESIARRFIDNFNVKISPLLGMFVKQNIKWTTGLKIASLIQREAAGSEDMKNISGIIWNRLNMGMKLEIDATMQYTKGKKPDGSWWGGVDITEKRSDSPYNTYFYKGLPPTPICSPGIDAIRAVLEPEETDCIFYLHDRNRQIHCSKTYAGHLLNIKKYLR